MCELTGLSTVVHPVIIDSMKIVSFFLKKSELFDQLPAKI